MDAYEIPDIGQATANGLQPLIQQTLAQQAGNDQQPEMIEQGTRVLENATALTLQTISLLTKLGPLPLTSWREIVDRFVVEQVGDDASPAVKLAAEQALILHFGSLALRVTAAGTTDVAVVQCNGALATSMQGELRKLLLDLERIRRDSSADNGNETPVIRAAKTSRKRVTKKRPAKGKNAA